MFFYINISFLNKIRLKSSVVHDSTFQICNRIYQHCSCIFWDLFWYDWYGVYELWTSLVFLYKKYWLGWGMNSDGVIHAYCTMYMLRNAYVVKKTCRAHMFLSDISPHYQNISEFALKFFHTKIHGSSSIEWIWKKILLYFDLRSLKCLKNIKPFLDFHGFDFIDFLFTAIYNSILFSSPLVLLSNLDLRSFCFRGFIFVSPH